MKTSITIFKEGKDAGSTFRRGRKRVNWEDLTAKEQQDLILSMQSMYELFRRFAPRYCDNCGKPYKRTDEVAGFCSEKCLLEY